MPTHQWAVTDKAGNTSTRSVTYATSTPSASVPVIGVNTQSAEPNYYSTWPVARVYRLSHAATAVANYGCQIVAVTDDPNVSRSGGAAAATQLRNALEAFYYGSGSAARQNVEYHFANGNEVDREFTSGSLPAAVVDTWRRMYDVVHERKADGTRRYPKASMWVDMTTWQVRTAGAGQRFKAIAPYLDGVAASLYPPGREADPVVFNPYHEFVDPVIVMTLDWRASYPNVQEFACWEFGIPFDHSGDNGEPNVGGTTDWTIRPAYVRGFLDYLHRRGRETGLRVREVCYWNEQSNPDIPNPFKHDRGRSTPDTVTAWRTWAP